MTFTIHKIFVVTLGINLALIFANSNAYAEDNAKINFNIPHSMNALITFQHCKVNSKIKDDKIVTLSAIIKSSEAQAANLRKQNNLLAVDFSIKSTEAKEWEAEYLNCTEALVDARNTPWYKFDSKSILTGILGTLGVIILL